MKRCSVSSLSAESRTVCPEYKPETSPIKCLHYNLEVKLRLGRKFVGEIQAGEIKRNVRNIFGSIRL